jgi:hypothetical protein
MLPSAVMLKMLLLMNSDIAKATKSTFIENTHIHTSTVIAVMLLSGIFTRGPF